MRQFILSIMLILFFGQHIELQAMLWFNKFSYTYCEGSCPNKKDDEFDYLLFNGPNRNHIEARNRWGKRIGIISFGVASNTENSAPQSQKCSIGLLEVMFRCRGKGVGKELWQQAIKKLAEQGCEEISWQARYDSFPFYKKMGVPDSAFEGYHVKYKVPAEFKKKQLSDIKN